MIAGTPSSVGLISYLAGLITARPEQNSLFDCTADLNLPCLSLPSSLPLPPKYIRIFLYLVEPSVYPTKSDTALNKAALFAVLGNSFIFFAALIICV